MSDTLDPEAIDGDSSDECLGCFTLKRELAEARRQRDALAEAFEKIALAAVKGGEA
jgi:hypothetical protein